jgi:hypothetical protein
MPSSFDEHRIISRPLGIEWAGWRSDTLTLQRCGWRLAVNFEPYNYTYQLLMKNETLRLCGVSSAMTIESRTMRWDSDLSHLPIFRVVQVAPDIHVRTFTDVDLMPVANFEEIDATPQFVSSRIESLYDLNVFATKRAEQVLVDKADMTVIEHLEAIKRLQSPKQQEIRQRLLREEREQRPQVRTPQLHLVAQLVHYAEAA